MLTLNLKDDIKVFNQNIKKIKREKPLLVALQNAPQLSEEKRISLILEPLDGSYDIFMGDILHKTDHLILVKSDRYKVRTIRDDSAIDWMLSSSVNMLGIVIEPKENGQGHGENYFRQLVFSIYVEPGASDGDIIENGYFIRKKMVAERLSVDDLVLLCDTLDEKSISLIKIALGIEVDGSKRRTTRKR